MGGNGQGDWRQNGIHLKPQAVWVSLGSMIAILAGLVSVGLWLRQYERDAEAELRRVELKASEANEFSRANTKEISGHLNARGIHHELRSVVDGNKSELDKTSVKLENIDKSLKEVKTELREIKALLLQR